MNADKKFDEEGFLLYEGETRKGRPFGKGTEYYKNGNKFKEGIFGVKGLIDGREFYPNGIIRFEGRYRLNKAYGPNFPTEGNFYNEKGELIYSGKSELRFGGVGYPVLVVPRDFGPVVLEANDHELMNFTRKDAD